MKPFHALLASVAVLPLLAAPALAAPTAKHHHKTAPSTARLAAEVEALKASNQALQTKLDALVASLQQTSAKTDATAAKVQDVAETASSARVIAQSAVAKTETIPTKVAAAVEAVKPKTDKLYYKGLALTLGGYVDMTAIYRSRNQLADDTSTFAKIPYANNPLYHQNETRMSGRGSRFSLLAQGDVTPSIHLSGYGEVDFLGAAQTANNNETSSYNPRIRQGWLGVDLADQGLLITAGQGWSLATLNTTGIKPLSEAIPNVLEYSYMPGFVYARQAELRVAKRFDNGLTLAAAVENPATLVGGNAPTKNLAGVVVAPVASATGGVGFNSANSYTLHSAPDMIAKAAYDAKLAGGRSLHLEGFGLYRQFKDRVNLGSPVTSATNFSKDGGGFGLGLFFNAVPKVLDLTGTYVSGKGLGRYGASQLADVTYAADGSLTPLKETLWVTGATFHATPELDIYAYAGSESVKASYGVDGASKHYGYGDPAYDNTQCFSVAVISGAACTGHVKSVSQWSLGFWKKTYVGAFGRIQYGAAYSYTRQEAFAGVGGQPTTNDAIVMTSIRYYPF